MIRWNLVRKMRSVHQRDFSKFFLLGPTNVTHTKHKFVFLFIIHIEIRPMIWYRNQVCHPMYNYLPLRLSKYGSLILVFCFRHPVAVGFHLSFKLLAFISYLLGNLLSVGFVINFIIVIVLLAMDFWTTKNVSGQSGSNNTLSEAWKETLPLDLFPRVFTAIGLQLL